MTDDTLKELVTKHDATISQLVASVEHLVASQTETNKRLEEISKFLAKQVVFSTKLEELDKNLNESFKRVHSRIDEIDKIQKSDNGCNSVRLLSKDVHAITKDVTRLIGSTEEQRISIESLDKRIIPRVVLMWITGIVITYSVMFGTYTIKTFNNINNTNARLITLMERNIKDIAFIQRNLK